MKASILSHYRTFQGLVSVFDYAFVLWKKFYGIECRGSENVGENSLTGLGSVPIYIFYVALDLLLILSLFY